MKQVMAIVLNYNSYDDTVNCVRLLKAQKNINLGICVVDNGSSDEEKNKLVRFCNENSSLFISSEKNNGYSAGNNIGLKRAVELGYEYALIINPDVEIRDENYLSKAYKDISIDDEIVVLGTDIVLPDRGHQNPMRELKYWEDLLWPIIILRNKAKKNMPYIMNYSESNFCEKLSGCCFLMDLDFAKQIGYLDENVFLYSEEAILAAAVKKQNKKMYYESNLTAYHMHNNSENKASANQIKEFLKSRKYYLNNYSKYGKVRLALVNKSIKWQEKVLLRKYKKTSTK